MDAAGNEPGQTISRARPVAAIAIAVLAPLVLAALVIASRDHLPDPLPTHWGTRGDVDGYTSRGTYGAILLGIGTAGALAAAVVAGLRRLPGVSRRALVAVGSTVSWGAVGIWAIAAIAAWDASIPADVPLHPWVFCLLLLAVAGGVASYLAYGPAPAPPLPPLTDAEIPVARLAPGERVAWMRRIGEPMFYLLSVIVLGLGLLIVAIGAPWEVAIPLVLAALLCAAFASIQLSVDARGLRVGVGPRGRLGKHIPLDRIAHVSVLSIEPMQWGGWGYRVQPGRSALVLRRGPGFVVDLTDGRRFAVTVDDPGTPASLLNALAGPARP